MLIFRRWKVALPLLLVAIGATVWVGMMAKPDYTMTAYVQLIPARVAATDDPSNAQLRNPWNQLGLATLGQASIYATQDKVFVESLKAGGHTDTFTLTMNQPNPIIMVEVVASTPGDARATTELVIGRLRNSAEVLQKQAGAQAPDIIPVQRLDQGQNLEPSNGKVKRALAAVAAAGLLMTAGGTIAFDALARRRSRRREERKRAESTPQDAPATATLNGKAPATARINGKEVASPSKVPVIPGDHGEAADESIGRTGVPPEKPAELPSAATLMRPPGAATYQSVNVRSEANGENLDAVPPATNGRSDANSSDVRIVLQPKRVAGENGGKP